MKTRCITLTLCHRFTSRRDILALVNQLRLSDRTGSNMAAGFQRLYTDVFVMNRGSRPSAAKYVILLTDGTTSKDPLSTQFQVIYQLLIIRIECETPNIFCSHTL